MKTKKKNNNNLWTGLAAGAAVGLLTFLFVKPKVNNKSEEAVSDNVKFEEGNAPSVGNLFI